MLNLISIYGLDDYFVYLSISYIYEMCGCAFVSMSHCCNLVHIHFWHNILLHDYTHPFWHPMFCKIVQLSSHMLLSVIYAIINPCISLGGAPCTNLENKTLLCLIVEKL
jgi:hypothetical protein